MLDRPRVRAALAYFHRFDGTRLSFRRILDNLLAVARERPIVIQGMFVAMEGADPPDAEIEAYTARLREIVERGGHIDRVQVYTVARRPADARVGALPDERLEWIAARVRAEGVRAEVYCAA